MKRKRKSRHSRKKTKENKKKIEIKRDLRVATEDSQRIRWRDCKIKRISTLYLIFLFSTYLWEWIWWLKRFYLLFYRKLWIKVCCGWVINTFNGYLIDIYVLLCICYSILSWFYLLQFRISADLQFSGY